MIYRRFYFVIFGYLAGIILFALGFAFSFGKDLTYSALSCSGIVLITAFFAIWLNRTNKKLSYFFSAVRNEDTSFFFPEGVGFASEKLLNRSLNELNTKLKDAKINIELQEKFYKSIMENIRTGIISFYKNGVVEFTNPEIKRMFGLDHISHINKLHAIDPKLVDMLEKNESGEDQASPENITPRIISDTIRGLNIIEDHGKGLIHFVESYRSLTQLPKPEFNRVNIKDFFERIMVLINSGFDNDNSNYKARPLITSSVTPDDMSFAVSYTPVRAHAPVLELVCG